MNARYATALLLLTQGGPAAPSRQVAPVAEYELHLVLQPSESRLLVDGTVRLALAQPADSLRLVLWSELEDVRFELLAPAPATRVTTDSADGDRSWFLHPAAPLPAGGEVVVRFSYRADSAKAPQFRVTPGGSFAGGGGELWYPRMGFDSLAIGMLRFEVPPGETVIAPGASLATPAERAAGRWAFRVEQPAIFGFASGRYEVRRHAGSVPVSLYSLRARPDADAILAKAAQTLDALSALFGPLPFPEYGIVEVGFGGAVSGTSEAGFFLADRARLDEGFSVPFFAHEIGHGWWGNLVRSRPGTAGRMLLSEGIAQYGMLQVLERLEGSAAAESFRRGEYPGYTLGGATPEYFRLAAAGMEVPLAAFAPQGAQVLRMHRMANTRGFLLLEMLGSLIGRERFHAALRRFIAEHRARPASWPEFEAAMSRAGDRDLGWFFTEWFVRGGAPSYELVWRANGRTLRGEIRQADTSYGAVLELVARSGGREAVRTLEVRGRVTPFTWTVPFAVDTLLLDPHEQVLRWTPERRRWAAAFTGFTRADWTRRFGDRRQATAQYQSALDSVPAADAYGLEFLLRLGLARSLVSDGQLPPARAQLDSALRLPRRWPDQLPFAYLELARLARTQGDSATMRWAAAAVARAEAGAGIRTAAGPQALELLSPPR